MSQQQCSHRLTCRIHSACFLPRSGVEPGLMQLQSRTLSSNLRAMKNRTEFRSSVKDANRIDPLWFSVAAHANDPSAVENRRRVVELSPAAWWKWRACKLHHNRQTYKMSHSLVGMGRTFLSAVVALAMLGKSVLPPWTADLFRKRQRRSQMQKRFRSSDDTILLLLLCSWMSLNTARSDRHV